MARYPRIQRNYNGGLSFRRRRRGIPLRLMTILIGLGLIGLLIWQFNAIQSRVVAMIIGAPSVPTLPPSVYAKQGDAAYWAGNLDEAVANFRRAAEMMPNNVAVIYELVRMLIYRSYGDIRYVGDIAEAEQWAARAVEVAPNDSRAHTINCYALVRAEKASAAVQSCIRAIEINPNDAESHAYLSMAQYDLQRTSAALNEAREAVRLNPRSIDANIAYALSLSFQGQFDQALEHYKNAASLNAKLEFPLFQMAFFAYTLGNAQQERNPTRAETLYRIALSAYNTILQNNPNSVKAYTRICQTYLGKGDPREARLYCQKAVEIDPESSQAWRWLGEVYHKSRNYEDAVEALRTCAQLEQQQGIPKDLRDPTCYYLRGIGFFILGQCDVAIPILEEVLSWTTDEIAIRETRRTIDKCATAYEGLYRTPTPIPSPTPRPTPIL